MVSGYSSILIHTHTLPPLKTTKFDTQLVDILVHTHTHTHTPLKQLSLIPSMVNVVDCC